MLHRFAGFELDTAALTLRESGRLIPLPRKTVEVLALLVSQSGKVVTKQQFMDCLWPDGFVEDGNLTQHIYLLRRAFRGHGGSDPIQTVPRRGYCFRPPAVAVRNGFRLGHGLRAAAAALLLLTVPASAMLGASAEPLSGEALHAYTLGRYFWNLRSVSAMTRSVAYFKRVIALSPRSALGYAALADAYTELADFERPCSQWTNWRRRAEAAATHALSIDPASSEAHVAYGMVRRVFWNDGRTATREFQTALRTDPNNPLANQWYGNMLIARGETAQGLRRLHVAAAEQPVSTATYAWIARGYYYEGRYDDAVRYARQALEFEPTRLETMVVLGLSLEAQGHFNGALEQFKNAARAGAADSDVQALDAGVYAAMGRRTAALATLQRITGVRHVDLYTARDAVIAYVIAGNAMNARELLARIHYRTPLDRELTLQDPHIRPILGS